MIQERTSLYCYGRNLIPLSCLTGQPLPESFAYMQPSSAASERVFSLLKVSFQEQQDGPGALHAGLHSNTSVQQARLTLTL